MLKGVFIGLAIIIILPVIPIVHIAFPFGPFIAGAYGINAAASYPGKPGRKALVYGAWFGAIWGGIFVLAAFLATVVFGFDRYVAILWAGVVIATFYFGSMSALGAWYSGLRAEERAGRGRPAG